MDYLLEQENTSERSLTLRRSPYGGDVAISGRNMPLGMWTCLRIVYWQKRGLSIDLSSINRWATDHACTVWNLKIEAFMHFPWGLPEDIPNTIDGDVWDEAEQLLKDVHRVHDGLRHHATDVVEAVEALRKTDIRIDMEVTLTEALWRSETVRTLLASFSAPRQKGGTCYANACAAAISLANCRIVGRDALGFHQLRQQMIDRFGYDGAYTDDVLDHYTVNNVGGRLRYEEVNAAQAREILRKKHHPLVAIFVLTDSQWEQFSSFFDKNPTSSMPNGFLHGPIYRATGSVERDFHGELSGHAVLATNVDDSNNLILLNSWGTEFGNNGTFKVQGAAVLRLRFYHIYFLESDLSNSECEAYRLTANYLYTVQKVARRQNPFPPAITQGVRRLVGRRSPLWTTVTSKNIDSEELGYEILNDDDDMEEDSLPDEDEVSEYIPDSDSDSDEDHD